jgi:hypothetical protein
MNSLQALNRQPLRCEEATPAGNVPGNSSAASASSTTSKIATSLKNVASPVLPTAQAELSKWQRTFDLNAKVDLETGEKWAGYTICTLLDCS